MFCFDCFEVNYTRQVQFLFPTGIQVPMWHRITLVLGSKNLGNCAK